MALAFQWSNFRAGEFWMGGGLSQLVFFGELQSNSTRGGGADLRLDCKVGPSSLLLRNPEPCVVCHLESGQCLPDLFLNTRSAPQSSPAYLPQMPAAVGSAKTGRHSCECSGESPPSFLSSQLSLTSGEILSLHWSAPCWLWVSYCTLCLASIPCQLRSHYTKRGKIVLSGWDNYVFALLFFLFCSI